MDMHRDSGFVGRLEVVETGRRRRWSVAEKARIVEESLAGERQASQTARRYGISNSLMFKWRKAYREGRLGGAMPSGLRHGEAALASAKLELRSGVAGTAAQAGFVPAVIVPDGSPADGPKAPEGRMEVVGVSGRRIVVGPDFDAEALGRLLAVVDRRPVCRSPGEGR